jgi:hypothetical protein
MGRTSLKIGGNCVLKQTATHKEYGRRDVGRQKKEGENHVCIPCIEEEEEEEDVRL